MIAAIILQLLNIAELPAGMVDQTPSFSFKQSLSEQRQTRSAVYYWHFLNPSTKSGWPQLPLVEPDENPVRIGMTSFFSSEDPGFFNPDTREAVVKSIVPVSSQTTSYEVPYEYYEAERALIQLLGGKVGNHPGFFKYADLTLFPVYEKDGMRIQANSFRQILYKSLDPDQNGDYSDHLDLLFIRYLDLACWDKEVENLLMKADSVGMIVFDIQSFRISGVNLEKPGRTGTCWLRGSFDGTFSLAEFNQDLNGTERSIYVCPVNNPQMEAYQSMVDPFFYYQGIQAYYLSKILSVLLPAEVTTYRQLISQLNFEWSYLKIRKDLGLIDPETTASGVKSWCTGSPVIVHDLSSQTQYRELILTNQSDSVREVNLATDFHVFDADLRENRFILNPGDTVRTTIQFVYHPNFGIYNGRNGMVRFTNEKGQPLGQLNFFVFASRWFRVTNDLSVDLWDNESSGIFKGLTRLFQGSEYKFFYLVTATRPGVYSDSLLCYYNLIRENNFFANTPIAGIPRHSMSDLMNEGRRQSAIFDFNSEPDLVSNLQMVVGFDFTNSGYSPSSVSGLRLKLNGSPDNVPGKMIFSLGRKGLSAYLRVGAVYSRKTSEETQIFIQPMLVRSLSSTPILVGPSTLGATAKVQFGEINGLRAAEKELILYGIGEIDYEYSYWIEKSDNSRFTVFVHDGQLSGSKTYSLVLKRYFQYESPGRRYWHDFYLRVRTLTLNDIKYGLPPPNVGFICKEVSFPAIPDLLPVYRSTDGGFIAYTNPEFGNGFLGSETEFYYNPYFYRDFITISNDGKTGYLMPGNLIGPSVRTIKTSMEIMGDINSPVHLSYTRLNPSTRFDAPRFTGLFFNDSPLEKQTDFKDSLVVLLNTETFAYALKAEIVPEADSLKGLVEIKKVPGNSLARKLIWYPRTAGAHRLKLTTASSDWLAEYEIGNLFNVRRFNYFELPENDQPKDSVVNHPDITSFSMGSGYPNPFNHEVVFRIQSPNQRPAELVVFDVIGRRLFSEKFLFDQGEQTVSVSMVPGAASGLYFFKWSVLGEKDQTFRLIFQK